MLVATMYLRSVRASLSNPQNRHTWIRVVEVWREQPNPITPQSFPHQRLLHIQ